MDLDLSKIQDEATKSFNPLILMMPYHSVKIKKEFFEKAWPEVLIGIDYDKDASKFSVMSTLSTLSLLGKKQYYVSHSCLNLKDEEFSFFKDEVFQEEDVRNAVDYFQWIKVPFEIKEYSVLIVDPKTPLEKSNEILLEWIKENEARYEY